jgi:hypothetical protein
VEDAEERDGGVTSASAKPARRVGILNEEDSHTIGV